MGLKIGVHTPFGPNFIVAFVQLFQNILGRPTISDYSLVPKERHVRKEGNGSTLWLSNGPKESHDSTVVKKLFQKRVMTAVLV